MIDNIINIHFCLCIETVMPQRIRGNAPFPGNIWMWVKMATFLCVLSADGSHLCTSTLLGTPFTEVRQLMVNVWFLGDRYK